MTKPKARTDWTKTTSAVITVGDGRGFVVEGEWETRLVITAAHCLPYFPPCHGASYLEERTYQALLGPLGEKPTVWAECLFTDPIADIAVLGSPDNQALTAEADAYDALMEASEALPVREMPDSKNFGQVEPAWLLSLDRRWFRCGVRLNRQALGIAGASEGIVGGMSGSPILADDGSAVGVVCTSGGLVGETTHTEGGPNPLLTRSLPGWFFCPRPRPELPELKVVTDDKGVVHIMAKPDAPRKP
jgi:Trypsin-like peptidase domain